MRGSARSSSSVVTPGQAATSHLATVWVNGYSVALTVAEVTALLFDGLDTGWTFADFDDARVVLSVVADVVLNAGCMHDGDPAPVLVDDLAELVGIFREPSDVADQYGQGALAVTGRSGMP